MVEAGNFGDWDWEERHKTSFIRRVGRFIRLGTEEIGRSTIVVGTVGAVLRFFFAREICPE
jgi:hypothetical protein